MWSKEWATNALNAVVLAFLTTFLGALTAGGLGVANLGALRAAAIAGLGAAVTALQAAVAQLVPGRNPTASLPRALVERGSAPSPAA